MQPARVAGYDVSYWRPFTLLPRKVGKLLNIAILSSLSSRLAALKPALIWIYNSYAFEGRMALNMANRCGAPIVLQLEDLPLSRPRGLNPKPRIDQYFFKLLLNKASLITYVNQALLDRYGNRSIPKLLLPSLLRKELTSGEMVRKFRQTPYRLGYFGGLAYDKGVDVILDALQDIPDSWTIVVTGSGTLQKRFAAAAKEHPNRLQYLGVVDQQRLASEMLACDAIVNPHKSISDMADGVFPFKVCEILASGALLISTALPSIDLDLSQGVLEFSGSPMSLLQAMAMAAEFYSERYDAITRLQNAVRDRFSEAAITTKLADALAAVAGDPLASHKT